MNPKVSENLENTNKVQNKEDIWYCVIHKKMRI